MSENPILHDASSKIHPVTTRRASEAIYDQLRELILSGEYQPGDRLPSERALMNMLQRSRPTIREAMRMLERAGFIRTMPGTNGAIVRELGTDGIEQSLMDMLQSNRVTVEELSEYRMENDCIVARWAAQRRDEADVARLAHNLDEAEQQVDGEKWEAFVSLDMAFHVDVAKAGKNTVALILASILTRLTEPKLLDPLLRQSAAESRRRCARILEMHRDILEAVRSGDPNAAALAMARHIHAFRTDLASPEAPEAGKDAG